MMTVVWGDVITEAYAAQREGYPAQYCSTKIKAVLLFLGCSAMWSKMRVCGPSRSCVEG